MTMITRHGIYACSTVIAGLLLMQAAGAAEWNQYGGEGGQQFTPLDQINRRNLERLVPAWTYRSGDLNQGFIQKNHSFQTNPIFWNDTLFISTSANWVIAIDAVSGEEMWKFDPELPKDITYSESASRGVAIWHGDTQVCPHRIFMGTLTGFVYALDAVTGQPCSDFGVAGRIDMSEGAGGVGNWFGHHGVTSPPAVAGDQLIVGSSIGDNRMVESPRGIVRSLDAITGAVNWIWDPIPRSPDDPLRAEWADDSASITGGANAWPPLSVDVERNLVFVPTSSPSADFYGGERLGDNRHANSLVALNIDTGAVVWHQQLVHHDVWDYDTPSQPTLTTIQKGGESVAAVVVVTKTGMLFAFERDSGEPIYEINERPVPRSDVPGELLSPTQPFSSIPALVDHRALTEDDAFGVAWFDRRGCQNVLRTLRSEGIFTPPSLQGSILSPGYAGGANWGGVAIDPERQIAITNVNQIPALVRLIPRDALDALRGSGDLDGWDVSSQEGTPYFMARRFFLSPLGLPCVRPPWGKLVAVDLREGTILWDIPLGTIRDLAPSFVPNFNWGVPNLGGALLTRSGLIVIGAATENTLRIFDVETGEELWSHRLPTAAIATPMSYEVEGVQYIAIAVGGHEPLGMANGDYLMTFSLEE
ncbi:MAG: pyrroloquinoline quinone-dependent dehydrogenase [Gammaproteobacteria bacterium]|nr:pyrroloquinoline quinone-dependent dehydrogenase [Gammaproteobacteria bacterium]MDP2347067.1 pyrroloquinoline quinone-dependent dehydrogenase [Gammaproteobacteria bacterium]